MCLSSFFIGSPVSILWRWLPRGQYARNSKTPQWSWHVKILNWDGAFNINHQFCAALPLLLAKRFSFRRFDSFRATRNQLADGPPSTPGIIRGWKAVFHMCNFRSLRDLEAAQSGVGMVHWRITYGWEEARFLKRTFISFIAKLWGFWVGEYAVHNFLDFPTARKKSSACRVGKLRKKISSFKFRQHRKVLPDFSTARSPAFSTWGKVSVRDECSSNVHSFTYSQSTTIYNCHWQMNAGLINNSKWCWIVLFETPLLT